MILVTVGMQLGFDRLIKAMDELAPSLDMPVIAQTGKSSYVPQNMEAREKIAPAEFEELVQQSGAIISHAGIGTVLTAQRFAKPIILFPRRFDQGEHRNDHQIATANNLDGRNGIFIAMDQTDLPDAIRQAMAIDMAAAEPSPTAQQLRTSIASFIESGKI